MHHHLPYHLISTSFKMKMSNFDFTITLLCYAMEGTQPDNHGNLFAINKLSNF